jgi:hypothetical protein
MDPNENLGAIRKLVREVVGGIDDLGDEVEELPPHLFNLLDAADDLAMYVNALDEWLSRGGFLPEPWEK